MSSGMTKPARSSRLSTRVERSQFIGFHRRNSSPLRVAWRTGYGQPPQRIRATRPPSLFPRQFCGAAGTRIRQSSTCCAPLHAGFSTVAGDAGAVRS